MKFSFLPLIVFVGRVDLVSSQGSCMPQGAPCGRLSGRCCSGMYCNNGKCKLPCNSQGQPCGGGQGSCCGNLQCRFRNNGITKVCRPPTPEPTQQPSQSIEPSQSPSQSLEPSQSMAPTQGPSQKPSQEPSQEPSHKPSQEPSQSMAPSQEPSQKPSQEPSLEPSQVPSQEPSQHPSGEPSQEPSHTMEGEWETITHDTFEDPSSSMPYADSESFGRVTVTDRGEFIYKGSRALKLIKDFSAEQSKSYDVKDYERLRLSFWVYTENFDYYSDTLHVKYSKDYGETYNDVESLGIHEEPLINNRFVAITEEFGSSSTEQVKIVLKNSASENDEMVYIDEVHLEGYKTNAITKWNEITYDDFEAGWGNFTAVKNDVAIDEKDARRVSNPDSRDSDYVPQGNAALRIRHNKNRESSVYHENFYDVSAYSECQVNFTFSAREMEDGDGFVLEYRKDGGGWGKAKQYIKKDKEDSNDKFYFRNLEKEETGIWNHRFYSDTVKLGNNMDTEKAKIRFRSRASGDNDYIYIDNVLFECRF